MKNFFNRTTFIQAFKFAIVGILNTLIGFGVYALCVYVFKWDYRLSNVISYVVGLINSFFWNKLWTFKSRERKYREIVWFIVIFLVSFGLQNACLVFFKEVLKWSKLWSYVIAVPVYTAANFLGNKILTFRTKNKPSK